MKIGDINIDEYVNSLTITKYARNQKTYDNLLGDRIIDRGKMKYKLSFKINLIENTEWSKILTYLEMVNFPITFFDAKEGEITRSFTISSIPSPRLLYAGNVTWYKNISLEMEEL